MQDRFAAAALGSAGPHDWAVIRAAVTEILRKTGWGHDLVKAAYQDGAAEAFRRAAAGLNPLGMAASGVIPQPQQVPEWIRRAGERHIALQSRAT